MVTLPARRFPRVLAVRSVTSALPSDRPRVPKGVRVLVGVRRAQDQRVRVPGADDLESDGQMRRREATRYQDRGLLSQVKGIAKRRPGWPSAIRPVGWHLASRLERGNRDRRREQQIEPLVEPGHVDPEVTAL